MKRCGRGCGWKTEGSETGCGRVWVWMEDEGERDWVRIRCGRGWKMKGSETGFGRVWMEDGGERDSVWTGVDGDLNGR